MLILTLVLYLLATTVSAESEEKKDGKALSVFNVVRFPNNACASASNFNGTCYTSSECISLGGSASGTCASSFGVCCVFNLACGATTTANTTYGTISSYSTSTDADPCTYTYCKNNADVCKLRIDFDAMVLAPPVTAQTSYLDGVNLGHCDTDTLTVGVPGYTPPPIICGYNTGQHMFVPASDSCVTITLDIDTATTSTTRSWNIRVTQYECGNLMAPEENCLQYHTGSTGTFASFNWDTTSTSNVQTNLRLNYHLANQQYDICIRRARSSCSVCYSPQIVPTATIAVATEGSSFGVSAGGGAAAATLVSAVGAGCTGVTKTNTARANAGGLGDYLNIPNLQAAIGTAGTQGTDRVCGIVFNAAAAATAVGSACSFSTPFRVGVHFDDKEAVDAGVAGTYDQNDAFTGIENAIAPAFTGGAGIGYSGFFMAFWQNTC